jgi:hypothetical protein
MDTVRVIHDRGGRTLTVWFGNPAEEARSAEDEHGVVVMKDNAGRVIGVEILGYDGRPRGVTLEWAEAAATADGSRP